VNICEQSLSGFHAHKIQIPVLRVATLVEASTAALLMVVLVAVMALVASESHQQEQGNNRGLTKINHSCGQDGHFAREVSNTSQHLKLKLTMFQVSRTKTRWWWRRLFQVRLLALAS